MLTPWLLTPELLQQINKQLVLTYNHIMVKFLNWEKKKQHLTNNSFPWNLRRLKSSPIAASS